MDDEKRVDQEPGSGDGSPRPKVDFTSFLLSLSSSVLVNLGEVPDPTTGSTEVHLEVARQTIDLLALIEEKTKGNLTPEEQRLVEHVLPDLKLRYLKAIKFLA